MLDDLLGGGMYEEMKRLAEDRTRWSDEQQNS